jgi:hypothetical protein
MPLRSALYLDMTLLYNYISISMLQVSLRFSVEFFACVWFYFSQGLRRHLLEELDQTFPDEVESYREIRAASAAVSNILLTLQFLRMIFSTVCLHNFSSI